MTSRLRLSAFVAIAVASSSLIFVLHGRLVPDTVEYAHGHAAWSSPLLALAGLVGGLPAVEVVAAAAAIALARVISRANVSSFAAVVLLLVALPVLGTAGADALGAWAAVVLYGARDIWELPGWARVVLCAICHLVAAFVLAVVVYTRRPSLGILAGLVAIVAEPAVGVLLGRHATAVQLRYLLPGLALVVCYANVPVLRVREVAA